MLISVAPAGLEQMFFEVGTSLDPAATSAPLPSPVDSRTCWQLLHGMGSRFEFQDTDRPKLPAVTVVNLAL